MKYPLGIQTFESLRKDGYVYVDKTDLIYQLTHRGKYFFLSRPRRFGKSLLLSTIEAYFQGKKHLFEGLAIEQLENEWPSLPVIHIDLNIGSYTDIKGLKEHLDYLLTGLEKQYDLTASNLSPSLRFDRLISHLAKTTGKNVVVLIDEYDKPILEAIGNHELQDEMRDEMRTFYSVLKSQERNIRFALLTGVTKFGRMNVFSELNNITDISFYGDYATICGITKEEIFGLFQDSLQEMANIYHVSRSEMFETLKATYDGYRFTDANAKVFNPYSLLSAFDRKRIGPYWFETGTPKYLVQLLQIHHYNLWRLDEVTVDESQLSKIDSDSNNPIPVIYQSGYLTIKDYNLKRNRYTLGFPNEEVRKGFMEYLLPFYARTRNHTAFDIENFVDDIESGNVSAFMSRLKSLTADISYEIQANCEADFQNLIYIIFTLSSIKPIAERCTSDGRIDLVVETDNFVYVMEFKIDRSAKEAIEQINSKEYPLSWSTGHRRVIKIGANFSTIQRRLTDYIIEEA